MHDVELLGDDFFGEALFAQQAEGDTLVVVEMGHRGRWRVEGRNIDEGFGGRGPAPVVGADGEVDAGDASRIGLEPGAAAGHGEGGRRELGVAEIAKKSTPGRVGDFTVRVAGEGKRPRKSIRFSEPRRLAWA